MSADRTLQRIDDALTPERLAGTTIWPVELWRHAYNGYSSRYDWAWFVDAVTKLGVNPLEFGAALDGAGGKARDNCE